MQNILGNNTNLNRVEQDTQFFQSFLIMFSYKALQTSSLVRKLLLSLVPQLRQSPLEFEKLTLASWMDLSKKSSLKRCCRIFTIQAHFTGLIGKSSILSTQFMLCSSVSSCRNMICSNRCKCKQKEIAGCKSYSMLWHTI